MRYIAAYLLLQMGGSASPSPADITRVLASVGIDCEAEQAKKVIDSLKGKNIEDIIAEGQKKLASVPTGASGGVAEPAPVAAAPAVEEKKEEKKEDKKADSDSDEDMGFGLFD